jgi:hypothetical protein
LKVVQKFGSFIIYSNLFIAGCAVLMANQTYRFLLHRSPDWNLLAFIFFATICSYSFHWYLTSFSVIPSPRIKWTLQNKSIYLFLFFTGLVGAAIFFFLLRDGWFWLLLSAIITFLYSAPKIPHPYFRALRKVAIGKTIFLAMVWMYVTTILPIVISQHQWKQEFVLLFWPDFF